MVAILPNESIAQIESCEFNFECFKNNKKCVKAPCELNKKKFGLHERIIDYYIEEKLYDDAYFYFVDLLHSFNINCDYSLLENRKANNPDEKIKTENLPLGCRVFKILDKLKNYKNSLTYYRKKIVEKGKRTLSPEGLETYRKCKGKFIKRLGGNIKILSHIVMKTDNERFEMDHYHSKGIEYLEKSIEASKLGINVSAPNMVEQGFNNAIQKAGFDNKLDKTLEKNQARLREADRKDLMKKVQREIKKKGELSEETKKELEDFQNENK